MRDQADQLRQIVSKIQNNKKDDNTSYARIITITSGKGGVGKTSFTINLAISLAKMGYRIVIIDGDFGLANVDQCWEQALGMVLRSYYRANEPGGGYGRWTLWS